MSFEKHNLVVGGLLGMNSLLGAPERALVGETIHNLRTASVFLREASEFKGEGAELSLFPVAEDVIEFYKDQDFDIVEAMRERSNGKFIWVRARAIDADTVNANGDYFSKEELLKDWEDQKGNKKPAYKTFEGVPIYTNHENNDITKAKGKVIFAEWDDDKNCVYCTFCVNADAYPDIVEHIRHTIIHDVSMGCQVNSGICSQCGHEATTEKEYCVCLKDYKGKPFKGNGKKVYEKNLGLKFIELSLVSDGAFDTCEILSVMEPDEVMKRASGDMEKKAGIIRASVLAAASTMPSDPDTRRAVEDYCRAALSATNSCVRLAQSAGTLVGGQMLAQEGADQNTTVGKILQFLGLDASAGLNVLDMLNLALNFLEVAVMNCSPAKITLIYRTSEKSQKAWRTSRARCRKCWTTELTWAEVEKRP